MHKATKILAFYICGSMDMFDVLKFNKSATYVDMYINITK